MWQGVIVTSTTDLSYPKMDRMDPIKSAKRRTVIVNPNRMEKPLGTTWSFSSIFFIARKNLKKRQHRERQGLLQYEEVLGAKIVGGPLVKVDHLHPPGADDPLLGRVLPTHHYVFLMDVQRDVALNFPCVHATLLHRNRLGRGF
jgi:hypothetical protein